MWDRASFGETYAAAAPMTWFLTTGNPVTSRKKWIAGALEPKGTLVIDAGAVVALRRGNSLLPVGVIRVDAASEQTAMKYNVGGRNRR